MDELESDVEQVSAESSGASSRDPSPIGRGAVAMPSAPSANHTIPHNEQGDESKLPLNRLAALERLYLDGACKTTGSLSLDGLIDCMIYVHDEISKCNLKNDLQLKQNFLEPLREVVTKAKELRLKKDDFEVIKLIGRGSFGEVKVVRLKGTNEIYALKEISKMGCIRRHDNARFHEERDVLVYGDRRWVTNLHYAFQDEENLYLIMEFYSGGDLVALMSKYEEARVPESVCRFYVAEVILALDSLHQLGYLHRDFKPDNVLIDATGHAKLGDFGSCVKVNERGVYLSTHPVGTPDYISPDILDMMNKDGPVPIGKEIDYWGVGVLLYEMLFGEPPFYSEDLTTTYSKILMHAETLDIPDNSDIPHDISDDARDLIRKLITSKETRLGRNGIDELKAHPFFKEIDWDNIHTMVPPYNPSVSGPTDTSNFDDVDLGQDERAKNYPKSLATNFTGFHLNFLGFTYSLTSTLSEMKPIRGNAQLMEAEKSELLRKYQEANALVQSLRQESRSQKEEDFEVTIAKLKDQIQILNTQLTEERSAKVSSKSNDVDTKDLKAKVKRLAAEKAELQRNLDIANELYTSRESEWKDTLQQARERAKNEFEEINAELSETKEKLEKVEQERREKADEVVALTEQQIEMRTEAHRHLTAKNSLAEQLASLTVELEALKVKKEDNNKEIGESTSVDEEVLRLREELTRLNERHVEIMNQEEKKRKQLVVHYQEQLEELQTQIAGRDEDIMRMKNALQSERGLHEGEMQQLTRNAEAQRERVQKTLQENIATLNIENSELKADLDAVRNELERITTEHKIQLKNIDGWITDQKETKVEMEELTRRLTSHVYTVVNTGQLVQPDATPLKPSAAPSSESTTSPASQWGNRKNNRWNRMGAQEAQLALEAEVLAKAQLQEELNQMKNEYLNLKIQNEVSQMNVEQLRREVEQLKAERHTVNFGGSSEDIDRSPLFNIDDGHRTMSPSDFDSRTDSPSSEKRRRHLNTGREFQSTMYENTAYYGNSPSTTSTMPAGSRLSTPKSIQALNNALCARGHQFQHLSADKPVKCDHCTSILVGLDRQGLFCQQCKYVCHVGCVQKAPSVCPVPRESKRPIGIDPSKGVGTAYEGSVKTPKAGGVKKGWQNTYVVVCDFKLFLYDCNVDRQSKTPDVHPQIRQVLDMRDPDFCVRGVAEQDVIHAQKSDLPKIFRISTSQIEGTSAENRQGTLLMADTADERKKWVLALNELVRLLKKSRIPDRSAFRVAEVFDVMTLNMVRHAQCASVIDQTKIVVGLTDGLFCIELDRDTYVPVGGEKENRGRSIEQVKFCPQEQLLIVMVGPTRERHVRLIPSAALDGRELKWIKVADSKGCHLMAIGPDDVDGASYFLAVAVKKTVIVYKIDRSEKRHQKWKEFAMPGLPQCMSILDGKLIVGFTHSFRAWPLKNESAQITLVNMEDQSLVFLSNSMYEAKLLVEVTTMSDSKEYLLVFDKIGLYVDGQGRRNRAQELMFPATAKSFVYLSPYLLVYSEHEIDVFHVQSGDWIQTINIRCPQPLNDDGMLTMSRVNGAPILVLLKDLALQDDPIILPNGSQHPATKKNKGGKRKFSIRAAGRDARAGDRLSKLPISGPSDFVHIVHMGPGSVELKNMVDLPQSATQSSSSMLGGLLRSTSNSSANAHSVRPLGGTKMDIVDRMQKGRQARPQSTTSRSSDGSSSLGRDGTLASSSSTTENAYMEPISKMSSVVHSPPATLSPSSRQPQ